VGTGGGDLSERRSGVQVGNVVGHFSEGITGERRLVGPNKGRRRSGGGDGDGWVIGLIVCLAELNMNFGESSGTERLGPDWMSRNYLTNWKVLLD